MNKFPFFLKSFLVIFLLSVAGLAFAADSPTADAYIRDGDGTTFGTTDADTLSAVSSGFSGTCLPSDFTYLKYDLSAINAEIGDSSSLVLTVQAGPPFGQIGDFALYEVTDDSWGEATIHGNNEPARGASPLATVPIATASSTGSATFSSAALATYLNSQTSFVGGGDPTAGDDVVSFAVGVINCGAGFGPNGLVFDSKETVSGVDPALNLFNPTAVELSTMGTDNGGFANANFIFLAIASLLVTSIAIGAVRSRQAAE